MARTQGLVEEEERIAKEAEQQMMEMFQASITLSPSEAAQAEADLAASEAAVPAAASAEDDGSMAVAEAADVPQPSEAACGGAGGTAVVGSPGAGGAVADTPTGVLCVLCGAMSLLQRHSVIFCARPTSTSARANSAGRCTPAVHSDAPTVSRYSRARG